MHRIPKFLFDRLRVEPIHSTVRGSLPVLFFGDPSVSRVATIGVNPSKQEYLTPQGLELNGCHRRFETLGSLGANSRQELGIEEANLAIRRMRKYFGPGRPVYSWFSGLSRVVEGMELSFQDCSASHLDLVQEATDPVWSQLKKLDAPQATTVLARDIQFLRKEIEFFPFKAIVCTSATVKDEVSRLLGVRFVKSGRTARVIWHVGTVEVSGRMTGVAAWNIPLKRATGLDKNGELKFGKMLKSELKSIGVDFR